MINKNALSLTTNAQCGGVPAELDKRRERVARRPVVVKQVVTMLQLYRHSQFTLIIMILVVT